MKQQNLLGSVLDRLIDNEPGVSKESGQYRLLSVSQIKASVVRDLENLLNTRRTIIYTPDAYKELNNSVFIYGIRDYTAQSPKSVPVRQQLRLEIEKAISQFEPRLKNVSVRIDTKDEEDRTLRFRINALLVVEPETEPVSFDTYFDVNRGQYKITT